MSDILIVDDERDIRELISEILIDEGYTTRLAGTSEDAIREVTSQPPGLMILDIWLKDSDMDGIDILKKGEIGLSRSSRRHYFRARKYRNCGRRNQNRARMILYEKTL